MELKWIEEDYVGIACDISSPGYRALHAATQETLGSVQPYSAGGSLPLVRDLQRVFLACPIFSDLPQTDYSRG